MDPITIKLFVLVLAYTFSSAASAQSGSASLHSPRQHKWALVLQGGAAVIERTSITAEAETDYRADIKEALTAAASVLDQGGSSLDAVEVAIKLLDNPVFIAGRGAVFSADGSNQLDAAIMDGKTMRAGSVADVQRTRLWPLSAFRLLLQNSVNLVLNLVISCWSQVRYREIGAPRWIQFSL